MFNFGQRQPVREMARVEFVCLAHDHSEVRPGLEQRVLVLPKIYGSLTFQSGLQDLNVIACVFPFEEPVGQEEVQLEILNRSQEVVRFVSLALTLSNGNSQHLRCLAAL